LLFVICYFIFVILYIYNNKFGLMSSLSQMFFNDGSHGSVGSGVPVVLRSTRAPAAPTPLLRVRSRAPMMNLSSIMTQNITPCRACGH